MSTKTLKKNRFENKSKRKSKKNSKTLISKSLKNRINKYILQKGDICCEEDFDRDEIINQIIKLYKQDYNDSLGYLDSIDNDLLIFIGYLIHLKQQKDKEGIILWNKISKMLDIKNKKTKLNTIKQFLSELPLYCLLIFLGKAYYRNIILDFEND